MRISRRRSGLSQWVLRVIALAPLLLLLAGCPSCPPPRPQVAFPARPVPDPVYDNEAQRVSVSYDYWIALAYYLAEIDRIKALIGQ